MTIRSVRPLLAATALLALGWGLPAGCFSLKEPPCAFSCVQPPHRCPEQYSCLADGLCHRQGVAASVCTLRAPGDAGSEASAGDADPDLTDAGGGGGAGGGAAGAGGAPAL